jgi:hypothetical protein
MTTARDIVAPLQVPPQGEAGDQETILAPPKRGNYVAKNAFGDTTYEIPPRRSIEHHERLEMGMKTRCSLGYFRVWLTHNPISGATSDVEFTSFRGP